MLQAGAPGAALHVSEAMLQRDPGNAAAQLRRGRALLALDRPAEAAQAFAAASAPAGGDGAEALIGLARARTRAGDAVAAEAAWRAALDRAAADPPASRARLQAGLAIALDLQGRHDAAQPLYRTALAQTPDDAALRTDLGLSLALSGASAEALPLLRAASDAGAPGSAEALRTRHNLAVGLALAGDEAGARAVLTLDLGPEETTAALTGLRQMASAR